MNDMWEALEKYQPYADKHGFGAEWRRMTEERTPGAAAWTARAAAVVAVWAAWAAAEAARVAARVAWADAARAVEYINEAIKLEETK